MSKILIVEDEYAIREMVKFTLKREGYSVYAAADALEAKQLLKLRQADLVLLDLMLPGQSGLHLARELRQNKATESLPIIMLTAKDSEQDKIEGLDVGADDYITKPFSPKELHSRIKALLRRVNLDLKEQAEFEVMGLRLLPETHEVYVEDRLLKMGPTEFRLLAFLISRPERVFSRSQLLDYVWGDDSYIEERTVDVHIRRLRIALQEEGYKTIIQTVRGVGYRLSVKGR